MSASPIAEPVVCVDPAASVTVAPGVNEVTLSWTNPSDGPAPEGVYLEVSGPDGFAKVVALPGPVTTGTVSGLRNGVTYSFRAITATRDGSAEPTAWVSATPTTGMEGVVAGLIVEFEPGSEKAQGEQSVPGEDRVSDVDLVVAEKVNDDAVLVELSEPVDVDTATRIAGDLAQDEEVAWAEPDQFLFTASESTNSDNTVGATWNLAGAYGVDAAYVEERENAGEGVTVAVIDTGITSNPDLDASLVDGYDFVSSPEKLAAVRQANAPPVAFDGDYVDEATYGAVGRDSNPQDPGDWRGVSPTRDSSWHGTGMAGLIKDVAPGASIQPVRALSWRGGLLSDIAASITWASGGTIDGVPANANPSKVINMSFAVEATCPVALQDAIDAARERGSILIAAAGNASDDASKFAPGNCNGVITVGSTTEQGTRADYSNYGPVIDIAAPGGDTTTPVAVMSNTGMQTPDQSTRAGDFGTSVSASHVAAGAAILASANPTITPDEAYQTLTGRDYTKAFAGETCDAANPDYSCGTGILSLAQIATVASGDTDYAMSFNGTNQSATTNSAVVPTSGAFTVEAWVYDDVANDSSYKEFVSQGPTTSPYCSTAGNFYLGTVDSSQEIRAGDCWPNTGVDLPWGQWAHVALVYNGSGAATLYLNGQEAATKASGFLAPASGSVFRVGQQYGPHGEYWEGRIDEVRVFDDARTEAEILADMHNYGPTNTDNLVAYYDFNEGPAGTTGTGTVYNRATGSNSAGAAGNLRTVNGPTYTDITQTTSNGNNTVVTFPRSYLTAANGWRVPDGVSNADTLVVGGGGGGGSDGGGGGGGGGVRYANSVAMESGSLLDVTVGTGGLGGSYVDQVGIGIKGRSGGTSQLSGTGVSLTATGGGGGSGFTPPNTGAGGTSSGDGSAGTSGSGGGGPGTCTTGQISTGTDGSAGYTSSISGSSVGYAGGGGGGSESVTIPMTMTFASPGNLTTGSDGGGNGAAVQSGDVNGKTGLFFTKGADGIRGGGGGAGSACGPNPPDASYNSRTLGSRTDGGNGGSGVVIVSYSTAASSTCSPEETQYTDTSTDPSTTYRVVAFKDTGSCTWTVPTGVTAVDYLVVGGGGGGGGDGGGGGGGGALNASATPLDVSNGGNATITVGSGGAGSAGEGSLGSDSTFTYDGATFSAGGGGGGTNGPTGGGAGSGGTGGTSTGGAGGVAAVNIDPATQSGTVGGDGVNGNVSSITGTSVTYGGGGGGGIYPADGTTSVGPAAGGGGGGGDGAVGAEASVAPGSSGGANTGGGGGGGKANGITSGGSGGSGIVVLRYVQPANTPCTPLTYPSGDYTVVEFQGAGTCEWTVPSNVGSVDVLAVGGGGGGGAWVGGGGGGGGVTDTSVTTPSGVMVTPGSQISVTVGAGGSGAIKNSDGTLTDGTDGGTSTFGTSTSVTALGGGVGASWNGQRAGTGSNVATGGGGSQTTGNTGQRGIGQISDGGAASTYFQPHPAGGGGGAGGNGNASTGASCGIGVGGAGGPGASSSITGAAVYYGGGGGGGVMGAVADFSSCSTDEWGTSGAGGIGGGATGASATSVSDSLTAASGTDGLGGGGGGAATIWVTEYKNTSQGGDGGDGVVIVRYLTNWISINAGDNQSGLPSQALATDPQVQVTDADGTGVDGVTVSFAVTTGGGSVGSASVTTSGGGYASTPWTLGNASATQTLTATATAVGGSPVTFTASTLYTLTYDANGGASPPVTQTGVDGADLIVAAKGSMSRTGYLFDSWNTAADGSGTTYNPTETYTMSAADVTLYAQWTPDIQTLSYSANGGSGAPSPVVTVSGGQVTVSATTPTRTGHTFDSWNTAVGGGGDSYNAGEIVTMPAADVTLYAQWTPNTYTVSYNANGGSGAPVDASGTYGTSFTVSSTEPSRAGYTFNGWNTAADGSGVSWNAQRTFTVLSDVDLYAQWVAKNFTLLYNGNGGSGTPGPQEVATGSSVTISTTEPTRVGYTFDKWTTEVAGGGDAYSNPSKTGTSDQIASMPASDVTLFAQWSAIPYSITYAANGASGSVPNPQTANYLGSVTASSASSLTYAGHTLLGWNTAADGSGTQYSPGTTFLMPAESFTLYAQWLALTSAVTYDDNGGSGGPGTESATTGSTVTVSSIRPTRAGFTFTGWLSSLGGTVTGGDTFTMPATSVTFTAQWRAQSSGGGQSSDEGTGASADDITPVNPIDPPAQVMDGEDLAVVTEGGEPVTVVLRPTEVEDGWEAVGSGFDVVVRTETASGAPVPLANDRRLAVPQGGIVQTAGDGYRASSSVRVFLVPRTPQSQTSAHVDVLPRAITGSIYLGETGVDAAGEFAASFAVPLSVAVGDYVLQINGVSAANAVRSLNMGLLVEPGAAPLQPGKVQRAGFFEGLSADFSAPGKRKLRQIVRGIPEDAQAVQVLVTGVSVGLDDLEANAVLAAKRASSLAKELTRRGVTGEFTVNVSTSFTADGAERAAAGKADVLTTAAGKPLSTVTVLFQEPITP